MRIITVESVRELLKKHHMNVFLQDLIQALRRDYERWDSFIKMPRPAMHVPGGVLELMPICDNELYYSFKYVNCHPRNPETGQMTVVATGQLSRIDTGYPVLFSEMTLLTALRTAANTALVTDLMARKDASVLAVIGTGAQSEFQVKGMQLVRAISTVRYFDIDAKAMDKFEEHMKGTDLELVRCQSVEEAVKGADIITVCTACKANVDVVKDVWVAKGVHINALGGDTIGKTELELSLLSRSRIVVEYFDQSYIEGEIQRLSEKKARQMVHAEVHELIRGEKRGREHDSEVTLFDSVGIGLEDYSVLRLTYELAEKYGIGEELHLVPEVVDPKDLFGVVV